MSVLVTTNESAPTLVKVSSMRCAALMSDTAPPLARLAFALFHAGQSRKEFPDDSRTLRDMQDNVIARGLVAVLQRKVLAVSMTLTF
jgi:hypothetical protein